MISTRGMREEELARTYRLGEAHEDKERIEVIRPRNKVHDRDREGQNDLCVPAANMTSQLMPSRAHR